MWAFGLKRGLIFPLTGWREAPLSNLIRRGEKKHMDENREGRSRKSDIPVWEMYMLSTEEASEYFHIGINKLRRIISLNPTAEWILWNGSHAYIKRRIFEQLIDRIDSI